jgi:hypothetical protein
MLCQILKHSESNNLGTAEEKQKKTKATS